MASFNFVLNNKNVNGQNNSYIYNFPQGSFEIPGGSEMAVSQITIPYSWYNISSIYGNNSFSYTLTTGPSGSLTSYTVTVTLPDGFYLISDINNQLLISLKSNGFYWYNSTGTITYPISISSYPSCYTNALTFQYIPPLDPTPTPVAGSTISNYVLTFGSAVTLTSGSNYYLSGTGVSLGTYITGTGSSTATYTVNIPQTVSSTSISYGRKYTFDQFGYGTYWAGGNGTSLGQVSSGSTSYSAYITIPLQNSIPISGLTYGIGNILGFTNGNYPPLPQSYSGYTLLNSIPIVIYGNSLKSYSYSFGTITGASPPFPPIGSAVNGIIVRCNLVDNRAAIPSDVLDSFPITTTFGTNLNYLPISDNWVSLKAGRYNSIIVTFNDQNFNPLLIQDTNVLITLLIRFK